MGIKQIQMMCAHPVWALSHMKERLKRIVHLRWRYWVEQNACHAAPDIVSLRVMSPEVSETHVYGHFGSYNSKQDREVRKDPDDFMPLELFKTVIDEIASINAALLLWGSEPLSHPHAEEMLSYIGSKQVPCQLITRGALLDKYAEAIIDAGIREVIIAADGPEQVYRMLGSTEKYTAMVNGVRKLVAARDAKKSKVPLIRGTLFIAAENCHNLVDTLMLYADLGIDCATFTHSLYVTEGLGNTHSRFFLDTFKTPATSWDRMKHPGNMIEVSSLLREIMRVKNRNARIPVEFFPALRSWQIADFYRSSDFAAGFDRCRIPWYICNVLENGDVVTCTDYPDFSIGSINKDSLMTLWNCEDMKYFRTELIRLGRFPVCPRCSGLYRI